MPSDRARREEILETAAAMFASSGLRTSLKEIADACGILPGSLYHHFASKEAIVVELVERYRAELDQVATTPFDAPSSPTIGRSRTASSRSARRSPRAPSATGPRSSLTLYEPPTGAGVELVELSRQTPTAIDAAMLEILEPGAAAGAIRPGIDLSLLAERICQSMLHIGVGVFHRSQAPSSSRRQKCRMLFRRRGRRRAVRRGARPVAGAAGRAARRSPPGTGART